MADVQNPQTNIKETAQANPEPDETTGKESGESNDGTDVESLIREAVDKEVAGLRNKNQELLGKLKKQQDVLKSWEGLDPEKVRNLVQLSQKDEESRLIAEGKVDEVVNKRMQDHLQRHASRMEELDEQIKSTVHEAEHWKMLYNDSIVKNYVATQIKGLQEGSLPVVQEMVSKWLTVEDGTVIPSESAPMWSKGKLKPDQIQDYLAENYQFFFKPSTGGGATVGKRSYYTHTPKSKMSAKDKAAFMAEARSRGLDPVVEYNKLPD